MDLINYQIHNNEDLNALSFEVAQASLRFFLRYYGLKEKDINEELLKALKEFFSGGTYDNIVSSGACDKELRDLAIVINVGALKLLKRAQDKDWLDKTLAKL